VLIKSSQKHYKIGKMIILLSEKTGEPQSGYSGKAEVDTTTCGHLLGTIRVPSKYGCLGSGCEAI
jgi:hypothetical protein